jgi:hypothetical protein
LGLDEALSGPREDYRGALQDIYGNFPFTQSPLKVVEVGFHVADGSVSFQDVANMAVSFE